MDLYPALTLNLIFFKEEDGAGERLWTFSVRFLRSIFRGNTLDQFGLRLCFHGTRECLSQLLHSLSFLFRWCLWVGGGFLGILYLDICQDAIVSWKGKLYLGMRVETVGYGNVAMATLALHCFKARNG